MLPSLDPDEKFARVVDGLVREGFAHIVIVDDGSSAEARRFFEEAAEKPGCTVLTHPVNMGKGRALKTAFSYVAENLPELKGVITIDGDGQHLLPDIVACGDRMLEAGDKVVLGCRDFNLPGIPPRSVAGNKTTSRFFRLIFGIRLSDTQTGLRAIPAQYLGPFCDIEGERFEYETNMLLHMKRMGIDFLEQPIATVYDPEDYSSHYNPVKDSLRITRVMARFFCTGSGFRYAVSAVLSWILDNGLYLVLFSLLGARLANASPVAQVCARVVSSLFNFTVNDRFVFLTNENHWASLGKYYCLCVPQTLVSTVCLTSLVNALDIVHPVLATAVKIVIELILFVISYFIQKNWVFRDQK
ncbi:MAG: bifunctional glycosyltransferase family 2/GtrA family protein [Oscillospiraceae bacterium]|nr:bifunctional glycosyltransferase family 2/GtrA family protein [Oscillospiraceae bacterium]